MDPDMILGSTLGSSLSPWSWVVAKAAQISTAPVAAPVTAWLVSPNRGPEGGPAHWNQHGIRRQQEPWASTQTLTTVGPGTQTWPLAVARAGHHHSPGWQTDHLPQSPPHLLHHGPKRHAGFQHLLPPHQLPFFLFEPCRFYLSPISPSHIFLSHGDRVEAPGCPPTSSGLRTPAGETRSERNFNGGGGGCFPVTGA